MKSALLNAKGIVIGEVYGSPRTGNTIDVAGAFTADGDPINVKTYKISRSKANLAKAEKEQPLMPKNGVWTFYHLDYLD